MNGIIASSRTPALRFLSSTRRFTIYDYSRTPALRGTHVRTGILVSG
jgi:hypothetical protein